MITGSESVNDVAWEIRTGKREPERKRVRVIERERKIERKKAAHNATHLLQPVYTLRERRRRKSFAERASRVRFL